MGVETNKPYPNELDFIASHWKGGKIPQNMSLSPRLHPNYLLPDSVLQHKYFIISNMQIMIKGLTYTYLHHYA